MNTILILFLSSLAIDLDLVRQHCTKSVYPLIIKDELIPSMQTARLQISPLTPQEIKANKGELEALFSSANTKHTPFAGAAASDIAEGFGNVAINANKPGGKQHIFVVKERGSNKIIGYVQTDTFFQGYQSVAIVSFAIAPGETNKGYATEVGRAAIVYAFEKLGATHVQVSVDQRDDAGRAVVQKLGMQNSGQTQTMREAGGGTQKHEWFKIKKPLYEMLYHSAPEAVEMAAPNSQNAFTNSLADYFAIRRRKDLGEAVSDVEMKKGITNLQKELAQRLKVPTDHLHLIGNENRDYFGESVVAISDPLAERIHILDVDGKVLNLPSGPNHEKEGYTKHHMLYKSPEGKEKLFTVVNHYNTNTYDIYLGATKLSVQSVDRLSRSETEIKVELPNGEKAKIRTGLLNISFQIIPENNERGRTTVLNW